ncbi:MAG TPA: family 10 glycosylhydrolase, partial [Thermoanaerobaculia bacterium]|nr:family 10 glycosylhydrolase [Thermoanaerobaculia bacterium]
MRTLTSIVVVQRSFLPLFSTSVHKFPLLLIILILGGCVSNPLPHRAQELRGLWVATVNNGDWPSRRDLTTDQQKQELIAIFDCAAALHLNAIFLQVRPMADAFYPSRLEPWSEFLGAKPPDYDPLAFAVAEAHARGLELHAWFNPFRGNPATELRAYNYGRFVWMDPGDPDVQRRALDVITDVVRRYEVDGVHLDDYFYPYPENNADFPDEPTWQTYRGPLSRDAWRRENINRFVRDLYTSVKAIRPSVEVGISPFGIWRPRHPRQVRGLDAYAKIYADSKLWLQQGWVDYLAPQLYWPIAKREQSFPALLHWWSRQDRLGRGIVAGITINRPLNRAEIAQQIQLVRNERQAVGFILFSAHT